jgi:hypothetical protein
MEFNPSHTELVTTSALTITFLLLGMATTASAQTMAEVEKDCKQLEDVYKRFSDEAYWLFGQSMNGTITEVTEAQLKVYDKVMNVMDFAKQAEKVLIDFKKKYGQKGDDPSSLSERFTAIRDAGKVSTEPVPSPPYDELKQAIADFKVEVARQGDQLAQNASYVLDMIDYREDPQEVSNMIRDMVTASNLALKFNPNSEKAKELIAKAEDFRKAKVKELEEARKAARMPKNHPEFKGNAQAVVAKALEFINGKKTNPKFNYFAGTVASPWFERVDIFGNTIDYTIQVNIAYQTQGEPANVVHVYRAVLYTCTKKPEPGFCTSGVVMGWEFAMFKENMSK